MEKFNQDNLVLDKYDRPEDELETPEVVEINKRERAFNSEGGFRNLLRLKMVVEDLVEANSLFRAHFTTDFMQEIINDPKTYAYSTLGFNSQMNDIPEEELQSALKSFLETSKIKETARIDTYLPIIIEYESTTYSEALRPLKFMLEACKKSALTGDWKSYCDQAAKAKSYLRGIEDLVEICVGAAPESDRTRSVLKAKKMKV